MAAVERFRVQPFAQATKSAAKCRVGLPGRPLEHRRLECGRDVGG
jgi:hypothetical protein